MTKRKSSSKKFVPEATRQQLMALQQRYRSLLALLPIDPVALDCLDADDFNSALIDIELVSTEMLSICDQQMAILAALDE